MSQPQVFYIKENATSPAIQVQLEDSNGNPIDITGHTALKFRMRDKDSGTVKIDADAVAVDEATGIVKYEWVAADTDTPDEYEHEWMVTYADGSVEVFPSRGYDYTLITDDID